MSTESKGFLVAVYQGSTIVCDKEHNLSVMREQMKRASSHAARLIIFPELFVTGYILPKGPEDIKRLAETHNGPSFQKISQWAIEYQIGVIYGYAEKEEKDGEIIYYNSAQFIDKQGSSLTNFHKLHLWPPFDKAVFTPGSELPAIVSYEGVKIALLICYDVEFPEIVRAVVLKGAQFVAVPTASDVDANTATVMVRTRALENHIYVAYANHCGQECSSKYYGLSSIVNPYGDAIAAAEDDDCLLEAVLDISLCSPQGPSYITDRRPELYASIATSM